MTAPVAASGRVPGVTGWPTVPGSSWASCRFHGYLLEVWSTGSAMTWLYRITGSASKIDQGAVLRDPGETVHDCAIRVRILAEQALEAHLVEALAALRGAAT